MFANTITKGSSSGNHMNKQSLCMHLRKVPESINNDRPNGGNIDNHVHAGGNLPTSIL